MVDLLKYGDEGGMEEKGIGPISLIWFSLYRMRFTVKSTLSFGVYFPTSFQSKSIELLMVEEENGRCMNVRGDISSDPSTFSLPRFGLLPTFTFLIIISVFSITFSLNLTSENCFFFLIYL